VNPVVAKHALATSFFILIMSLGILPFLSPDRPEFAPDVMAIIVSALFIALVIRDVRKQARSELGVR